MSARIAANREQLFKPTPTGYTRTHRFHHNVFVVSQGLRRPLQSVPVVFNGLEDHVFVGAAARCRVLQRVAISVDANAHSVGGNKGSEVFLGGVSTNKNMIW
jgi:hypothetical protein